MTYVARVQASCAAIPEGFKANALSYAQKILLAASEQFGTGYEISPRAPADVECRCRISKENWVSSCAVVVVCCGVAVLFIGMKFGDRGSAKGTHVLCNGLCKEDTIAHI
jgi:hypothetical protein